MIHKCIKCGILIKTTSKYCTPCRDEFISNRKYLSQKKSRDLKKEKQEQEFLEKIRTLGFNGNNGESWNSPKGGKK